MTAASCQLGPLDPPACTRFPRVNAFHVVGALFAIWAVTVAFLGITREGFPGSAATLVGVISVLLALGAVGSAIGVGISEEDKGENPGERAAPEPASGGGPAGPKLELAADPSGQLRFDKTALEAKAGKVTIDMKNPSPVQHDVSIEGGGVDEHGKKVTKGGTSTVRADLKPGTYTFYCSVDAHRQGGMKGTLKVAG
jgi:plastocyanin